MSNVRKKTSALWSVFTRVDEAARVAKCDICEQKLSYKSSISNLKKHLLKKHPTEYLVEGNENEDAAFSEDNIAIEHLYFEIEPQHAVIEPTQYASSPSAVTVIKGEVSEEKMRQNKQPQFTPSPNSNYKKKTSHLWSYFSIVDDISKIAKCDACSQKLSYKSSITNLKKHLDNRHLDKKHPTIISNSNLKKEVIEEMDCEENVSIEHAYTVVEPSPSTSTVPIRKVKTPQKIPQKKLSLYIPKKKIVAQAEKMDRSIMNLFIHDFQPFSMVEDRGFMGFVKKLNPSYRLPGKKEISRKLIPAAYERCYDLVHVKLQSVNSFCLTTDSWTSNKVDNYLAVTVHYIDEKFEFKSILLGCVLLEPGHTSSDLAQEIRNLTDKFDITDKILIAVTDNATNIKNAIVLLQWEHFGCYAHTLNLIVQNSLDSVNYVIDKVKTIVFHFKRSAIAQEELISYQKNSGVSKPKKIIEDAETGWTSTFYMLQRFLELEDAVKTSLALLDHDLPVIQQEEWDFLRDLCKVLRPFEGITVRMSDETEISAGQVIIFTNGLKSVCEKLRKEILHENVEKILSNLVAGVNGGFFNIENCRTVAMCTFLDPRFKQIGFSDQYAADVTKKNVIELVTEKINEEKKVSPPENNCSRMKNEPAETDEFSIFMEFDSRTAALKPNRSTESEAIAEVTRYIEEPLLPRSQNPLAWWRENKQLFPNLEKVVREKFCMVATSVPPTRMFSESGLVLNERRNKLSPKHVGKLVFLNGNSYLLSGNL